MKRTAERRHRRWTLIGGTAALVALMGFTACTAGEDALSDRVSSGGGTSESGPAGEMDQPDADVADDAPEAARDAEAGAEPSATDAVALGDLDDAAEARMLRREGRITVAYPESFDRASREVSAVVDRLDGSVAGIESETGDDGQTRGAITVEVPVERFDELLAEVGELGQVLQRDVTTDDLTEEHVDLASRLRHLERQEAFYLDLFDEADGVEDAISIQRHLEQVQQRKEEVQGRLDQIERTTARSTLAIELIPEGDEPGATVHAGVGFGAYWDDAVEAFIRVAGTLLVLVVGAAPLMMAGGGVLAIVLLAVRLWRRPATQA